MNDVYFTGADGQQRKLDLTTPLDQLDPEMKHYRTVWAQMNNAHGSPKMQAVQEAERILRR